MTLTIDRHRTRRTVFAVLALAGVLVGVSSASADRIADVIKKLNESRSVVGTKEIKSYKPIFDAFLELDPPPMEIGNDFNNTTIHPKMEGWDKVIAWTESNPGLAKAILESEAKTLFGLPYDTDSVTSAYREAGLVCEIGVGGSLRNNRFPYLEAMDVITTYAMAESYRLLEAGQISDGLNMAVATVFLLRQCCDREFLDELFYSYTLTDELLANLRDMLYGYQEKITADQYREIAHLKLPFLRPDRGRLLMPEGDRVVSEALIDEVFDARGQADREKFARTFAEIQSEDAPLTRFGAARRWGMIAEIHDSEEASQKRLGFIYDDWWRRWRIEEYDPILSYATQFDRTNPIRYAAVIYSMENVEQLFELRNQLVASIHGTSMTTGVLGYHNRYKTYPSSAEKAYSQFVRKRSDRDPFDILYGPFKYRILDERFAVDTPEGRLFLEKGTPILYSLGQDHEDGRGAEHTNDGGSGDIVLFPPIQALQRADGLIR